MKKILKINAIIAVIICSILVFFTYKNNNTAYWNNWGNVINAKGVYLRNTKISGEELYSLLTEIAKEKNVNIVKTDYITKNKKTKLVKSVYIQDKTDNLFKENTMLKGSVLTMDDTNKNLYISTSMDKNTEDIGQIFDLFHDDEVEIWTLTRLKAERGSLDGDYIIRSSKQERVDDFIKAIIHTYRDICG